MFVLLLAEAFAGPPPCSPLTTADLNEFLTKAEVAFIERDKAAVGVWTSEATQSLRCLHQAVAPVDVARLYILRGLQTFLDLHRSETQQWFEAARSVDPDQPLPDTALNADHPLRVLFDGVNTTSPGVRRLRSPRDGWLIVDGSPSNEAPLGRTWLFQRAAPSGTVVQTALVGPADPTPAYAMSRSPQLALLAGVWHYPNPGQARVMGVTAVQLTVPLVRALDADLGLTVGLYGSGFLPALRLGGRAWILSGPVAPYVSGVVEFTAHANGGRDDDDIDAVIRPTVGLPVGLRWTLDAFALDAELTNTYGHAQDGETSRLATRVVAGISFPL